jgi:hypothetical protein
MYGLKLSDKFEGSSNISVERLCIEVSTIQKRIYQWKTLLIDFKVTVLNVRYI